MPRAFVEPNLFPPIGPYSLPKPGARLTMIVIAVLK